MTRPSKEELIKFDVDYLPDTDYAAFARLLQSKWRDKKGFPFIKYGNFLEEGFAKTSRANYLTDNIKELVTQAVLDSEGNKAMISEPRIWNNLLSSQPLCFNLFGELYDDLELATKYFKTLFPSRVEKVTSIKFEYAAGRGNKKYTGDYSAFDAFIKYTNKGKKGFIGIEVKYTESLQEETIEKAAKNVDRHYNRYNSLTSDKYFKTNAFDFVQQVPISQIWRDHLLYISHLIDYDEGFFVFLFPKSNIQCLNGVMQYQEYLISDNEAQTGFYPRYLDDFIKTLRNLHNTDWTRELEERYLGITS